MKRVALTGGIAEGKSTVLGYCKDAGFSVCSADELARGLFSRAGFQARLAELFQMPGPIDRHQVRDLISRDPDLRRKLNQATHSEIAAAILREPAQVVEVPLLIEACMQSYFERVWVVTCGPEEQLRRLETRVPHAEAIRLLTMQLPTKAKAPFADEIIRTNLDEYNVKRSVLASLEREFGGASV